MPSEDDHHVNLGDSVSSGGSLVEPAKPVLRWWVVALGLCVLLIAIVSVATALHARHERPDTPSPAPEDQEEPCRVEGTNFAWAVQLALLVVAVLLLLFKRHREHPKRTLKIWLMDTSKQGVSSGAAHFCGMLNTVILAHLTEMDQECGWYMASYTLDTTFGVFCAVTLLGVLERKARQYKWKALIHTGVYPNYRVWLKQLLAFTMIVMFARFLCAILLCSLLYVLRFPVILLCDVFRGHPKVFLVVVMLAGPGLLNAAQCWIQDNYLKKKDDDTSDDDEDFQEHEDQERYVERPYVDEDEEEDEHF